LIAGANVGGELVLGADGTSKPLRTLLGENGARVLIVCQNENPLLMAQLDGSHERKSLWDELKAADAHVVGLVTTPRPPEAPGRLPSIFNAGEPTHGVLFSPLIHRAIGADACSILVLDPAMHVHTVLTVKADAPREGLIDDLKRAIEASK
jgi:hypothetical protein